MLAIIPSLSAMGPLALLALLAPAVFAALMIWMKRWTAALGAASALTTVFLLQGWWQPPLRPTWWSTRTGLWGVLAIIAALAVVWSIRRPRAVDSAPSSVRPIAIAALILAVLIVAVHRSAPGAVTAGLIVALLGLIAAGVYVLGVQRKFFAGRWTVETALLAGVVAGCAGVATFEPVFAGWNASLRSTWTFEPSEPGAFLGEPWVEGDLVYIAAAHQRGLQRWGAVYALDRWTGAEQWRFDDGGAMKPVVSSPRVISGKLLIGEGMHEDSGCRMFCLNAETGEKLWEHAVKSHIESSATVFGQTAIFGAGEDGLRCVTLATGREVWRFEGLHCDATPVVSARFVFVGSYSGRAPQHSATNLVALDAANGRVIWEEPADMSCLSTPWAVDGRVFFGLSTGDFDSSGPDPAGAVVALDAFTGQYIWRSNFADGVVAGPMPLGENLIAIGRNGEIRALSRDKGVVKWTTRTVPIVARHTFLRERGRPPSILAVTRSGRCLRLESSTGRVVADDDLVRMVGGDAGQFLSAPVVVRSSIGRQIFVAGGVTSGLTEMPRLFCLMENE